MSTGASAEARDEGAAGTVSTILAYTSEDGRYDAVRRAGVELALKNSATLILYDVDAAGVFGEEPMPTWFGSEGEDELYPDRLSPHDLETLGRHEIARQVEAARAEGAKAYGWLTGSKAAGRLAEYVQAQRVDAVLLPAELDDAGLFQRLRGNSVDAIKDQVECDVYLVDEQGTVRDARDD